MSTKYSPIKAYRKSRAHPHTTRNVDGPFSLARPSDLNPIQRKAGATAIAKLNKERK